MLMKKIIKNLRRILFEDNFDVVELFGSINSFGWGMWFITHPNLFEQGTVYGVLATFANEATWGALLVLLGTGRLIGVALDRYRLRKAVAMIGTVLWAFVCAGFYQQNPNAIVVFVTAQNTLLSMWEYLRHSRRVRIRKEVREEIRSTQPHI